MHWAAVLICAVYDNNDAWKTMLCCRVSMCIMKKERYCVINICNLIEGSFVLLRLALMYCAQLLPILCHNIVEAVTSVNCLSHWPAESTAVSIVLDSIAALSTWKIIAAAFLTRYLSQAHDTFSTTDAYFLRLYLVLIISREKLRQAHGEYLFSCFFPGSFLLHQFFSLVFVAYLLCYFCSLMPFSHQNNKRIHCQKFWQTIVLWFVLADSD